MESSYSKDVWDFTLVDLSQNKSDLAMCSVWLDYKKYLQFDLTNHIDFQCGTFLVAKPAIVNAASYIYLSLSETVWIAVIGSFLLTGLCLTSSSWIVPWPKHIKYNRNKNSVYDDISRSYLDAICIITGHGLNHFPKQISIKWMLIR